MNTPSNLRPIARLMALLIVLALNMLLAPARPPGAAASDAIDPVDARDTAIPAVQPGPAYTVNTTADHDDGACDEADCTLREAIKAANAQTGANTVVFSVSGTITLTATLPNIVDGTGLTIDGAGQSIILSGNKAVRVLTVDSGSALTLHNLTITEGRCDGCDGGGIYNAGQLTVTNSSFFGNSASSGGGIANSGSLTVANSTFSGNSVIWYGGGLHNGGLDNFTLYVATVSNSTFSGNDATFSGGGLSSGGIVVLADSHFSDNSGGSYGGGLSNWGTATVRNSSFCGNRATAEGGGIRNAGSFLTGVLTVANSIFCDNSAAYGGGLSNALTDNNTAATVSDSTFSDNSATSSGGGLYNGQGNVAVSNSAFSGNSAATSGGGVRNAGVLTVTNSSFFGNRATQGGGLHNQYGQLVVTNSTFSGDSAATSGGGIWSELGATVKNSIVANSAGGGSCGGTITNGGNNIDDGTSCGFGTTNGSLSNTNPLLAPLGSYGGSTQTFALLPGSPAIDAGNDVVCADAATVNGRDQRGVARPQGTRCDIGAFESRGFSLARTGGDGQTALVNAAFAVPLQLAVSSPSGEPVDGGRVTFMAPSGGASTSFAPSTTAVITSSGAVSLTVTANGTAGAYQVTATTPGAVSPVLYNLTNVARPYSQVLPLLLYQVQAPFPISYTVADLGGSLERVELWYRWRRSDVPRWSEWSLHGSSTTSPMAFTAPRGAGVYQFYTVAVDTSGGREARPIGYDAKTRFVPNAAGQSQFFYGTAGQDPTKDGQLRGGKLGLWVDWATQSFQVFRMTSAYAVRSNVGAAMAVTGSLSAPMIAINYADGKLALTDVQIDVANDTATGSILDKTTGRTYLLGDPGGVEWPY